MKKVIYFGAGLFNWQDKAFNLRLTENLEKIGYKITLPQREGFEFSELAGAFEEILQENEIPNAANHLIYFLDKGWFIPKSDFCLAKLDEPIDEGVISEINFCNMLSIPVLGYRTDVRTPYGSAENGVRGAHFFPVYDCTAFMLVHSSFSNTREEASKLEKLAKNIDLSLKKISQDSSLLTKDFSHPFAARAMHIAERLFSGIENFHSRESLKLIAERYSNAQTQELMRYALPQIINA